MTPLKYNQVLSDCGGEVGILKPRERSRLLRQWRERYAAGLFAATGRWNYRGYEWHVFSFGHARALNGARAVAEYEAQSPDSFIICPEGKLPAVRITGGRLPDFRPERDDVYVWPDDLSWTMAFTHEESMGLGPYFSRSEWVAIAPAERHA